LEAGVRLKTDTPDDIWTQPVRETVHPLPVWVKQ